MFRNIQPNYNFDPPVSDDEVRAAALLYVRKISAFNKPSKTNEAAFQIAVDAVAAAFAAMAPPPAGCCVPSKPTLHRATRRSRSPEPRAECTAIPGNQTSEELNRKGYETCAR